MLLMKLELNSLVARRWGKIPSKLIKRLDKLRNISTTELLKVFFSEMFKFEVAFVRFELSFIVRVRPI